MKPKSQHNASVKAKDETKPQQNASIKEDASKKEKDDTGNFLLRSPKWYINRAQKFHFPHLNYNKEQSFIRPIYEPLLMSYVPRDEKRHYVPNHITRSHLDNYF